MWPDNLNFVDFLEAEGEDYGPLWEYGRAGNNRGFHTRAPDGWGYDLSKVEGYFQGL